MMDFHPPNQEGSIFLEVLLALILLTGGIVGGLEMTRMAQLGLGSSKNRVLAITLAQSLLEEKAVLSVEKVLGGPESGEDVFGELTREWRVTSPPSGLMGVTIRVESRWTDRSGRPARVELRLFRPGGRVP